MNDERNHEQTCTEAYDRLKNVAIQLLPRIGDVDVAGVLVGIGAEVLMETRGTNFAASYLREVADKIERANV